MLDAGKLATLRAVVAHGSFSAAARELALTQPAVARQVALLEARLGTPLVRRTRQGVRPTEAGRVLAEHAAEVERRLALAEEDVARLAGLQRGRVRLGSFFTAFALLAPEIAGLAEARLPGLVWEHELVDRPTAFARLAAGTLDLAVVFEHEQLPEPAPDGIELAPLFADPARVLLPAGHRLAARAELTFAELAAETWIRARDGGAARLLDAALEAAGIAPAIRLAGQGDEPVEVQVYVVAGAGVTLAHDLNVIVNPAGIAVCPLAGGPARFVQAAFSSGESAPAVRAALALLRELGRARAAAYFSAAGQAIR